MIAIVVAAAIVVALLYASKVSYSGALIGRVLDADTGKGVAGAVVVATWLIQSTVNAAPVRYIEVQEMQTGTDGEFHLSKWGPRLHGIGVNAPEQPVIRVVRDGFRPLVEHVMTATPDRNGEIVLRMQREKGSTIEQAEILQFVGDSTVAAFFAPPFQCEWKRVPLYLKALQDADAELVQQGSATSLPQEFRNGSTGCAQ
jgi:hypothetical protein